MSKISPIIKQPSLKEFFISLFDEEDDRKYECYKCEERNCFACEDFHSFYVSYVGKCQREIAYLWLYGNPELDRLAKRKSLRGQIYHLGLQGFLEEKGVLEEKEVKVETKLSSGFFLKGKVDAIINLEGIRMLVEFKTTSLRNVKKAPFLSHIKQVEIYLELLEVPYGELVYIPISEAMPEVVLENFDDFKFIPVFRNKKTKEIIKMFDYLASHILAKTLPQRETSKCLLCRFKEICWK